MVSFIGNRGPGDAIGDKDDIESRTEEGTSHRHRTLYGVAIVLKASEHPRRTDILHLKRLAPTAPRDIVQAILSAQEKIVVETTIFEPGNSTYIRGPFKYSGGIAPTPGHTLERATFRTPPEINTGFELNEAHLTSRGLPLTCFAACELRSPAPFDDDGFLAFNRVYVGTLEKWGLFKND